METEYKVIMEKEGMKFSRIAKNQYQLNFMIQNNKIHLPNIINFDLVKLIYDLNTDIYEKTHLEKINNNEAVVTLLMKHFFEDLGLPQRYSYLHVQKTETNETIRFQSVPIQAERPEWIPEEAQMVAIKSMTMLCEILSPHKITVSTFVFFKENHVVPPFMEKFVGMILYKIFNRLKQFIENYGN
jgi:hypothetical protein